MDRDARGATRHLHVVDETTTRHLPVRLQVMKISQIYQKDNEQVTNSTTSTK
jgi:hypothetical protein